MCIEILRVLKAKIAKDGFDEKRDKSLLEVIYGLSGTNRAVGTLLNRYSGCLASVGSQANVGEQSNSALPAQAQQKFLDELDEEIERIELILPKRTMTARNQLEVESPCEIVPDAPELDNVLRYETTVRRAIDRTLNQLERIQRKRKGEPLPPTVNLNL